MMKHYKDIDNNLFGYDTDNVPNGLTEISIAEARVIADSKIPVLTIEEKREKAKLTRREFFLGIDAADMYDAVMALKDDPLTPRAIVIELETATEFKRTWPTLVSAANQLEVTDAQLDALFGIEI